MSEKNFTGIYQLSLVHYTTVHSPNLFHSLLQSANATRELTTNGTQAEWQTVISLSLHCQLDNWFVIQIDECLCSSSCTRRLYFKCVALRMHVIFKCVASPVVHLKKCVIYRYLSFFTHTTRAKMNPGNNYGRRFIVRLEISYGLEYGLRV